MKRKLRDIQIGGNNYLRKIQLFAESSSLTKIENNAWLTERIC